MSLSPVSKTLICSLQHVQRLPPHIPSPIPYLGHAVEFGRNPIKFLLDARKKVRNSPTYAVCAVCMHIAWECIISGWRAIVPDAHCRQADYT